MGPWGVETGTRIGALQVAPASSLSMTQEPASAATASSVQLAKTSVHARYTSGGSSGRR